MTVYTAVPSGDRDPESPVTPELIDALYFNPTAITEGASGAPKIQTAAYDAGSVDAAALAAAAVNGGKIDYPNSIILTNGYLISELQNAIATGSINGWTDVTVSQLSMPQLYIDSNTSNLLVRILYYVGAGATTQSVDSRVTVDGTVSSTATTTSLSTGTWKWSPFMSVNVSSKSGWHNIGTYELRPVSASSGGYDIAAVQFYFT